MTRRIHVFADEAGNFDFSRNQSASRYFILTTVILEDLELGTEILKLRRQLAWEGVELTDQFHATEEKQAVRDRVFAVLQNTDFRIDATIFDKPKTQPHLQRDEAGFYQLAWYLHFKNIVRRGLIQPGDELFAIAASLGVRKRRSVFRDAVADVVEQLIPKGVDYRIACWPSTIEPCIQVADYCCWAIQRKWEKVDNRSYVLIEDKIRNEFDVFRRGTTLYY